MAKDTVSKIAWALEAEDSMKNGGLADYLVRLNTILDSQIDLSRGKLTSLQRKNIVLFMTQDIHNRDVIQRLVNNNESDMNSFSWTQELRFYGSSSRGCYARIGENEDNLANPEYHGSVDKLVITAVTEKAYLFMSNALSDHYCGAAVGPAGTGKTETIKDLARGLFRRACVYNAND